jgi:hypothetical protein
MPQRSRLSPESMPEEIRAARIEDARQVPPAIARAGRAALTSTGASSRRRRCSSPLSGSRFRARGIVTDNIWLHEIELIN